jgi:8-oxo-dGTP pyrophosphatase MutT (NUDIX family)
MQMNPDLAPFLASGRKIAEGEANWGGNMPLQITCCLSGEPAPLEYVSSVRALVFKDASVLVVRDNNGEPYLLPGGRREKGESELETLHRELLEETGWTLKSTRLFAFMHMHHLGPKPPDYTYPYPDFIWPIYIVEADTHRAEDIQDGKTIIDVQYVSSAEFHTFADTMGLGIKPEHLELLKAAAELRRKTEA